MSSAVTIAQLTDCHLKREPGIGDTSPDEMLQRAVALLAEAKPALVLLTGDIADDGSPAAYQRVAEAVAVLGAPVLATAGNHDDPAEVSTAFGSTNETTVGGWRICLVDTSIPATEHGRVGVSDVLDRLGADIGVPTVLAMHHPPISTSTHPWMRLDGGSELAAALAARGDVRVVLSGHLHEAFNVVFGGVSYIGGSSSFYSIKHRNQQFILDRGHAGALTITLADNGEFGWRRVPDPHEANTVLGPFE